LAQPLNRILAEAVYQQPVELRMGIVIGMIVVSQRKMEIAKVRVLKQFRFDDATGDRVERSGDDLKPPNGAIGNVPISYYIS
jgi:hypothetical protein